MPGVGSRIEKIPPEAMPKIMQNFSSEIINYLNDRVLVGELKQKCEPLTFSSVRHAEVTCEILGDSEKSNELLVTFCTNSNKVCFDARIEYSAEEGTFVVPLPLERANKYSKHSQCVSTLKEYCVCR